MMKLERETIINFNEAEGKANVYTHCPRLLRRLHELHEQRPNDVIRNGNGDYDIPKVWIRINPPRQMAELTEEQKRERSERLAAMRQK